MSSKWYRQHHHQRNKTKSERSHTTQQSPKCRAVTNLDGSLVVAAVVLDLNYWNFVDQRDFRVGDLLFDLLLAV